MPIYLVIESPILDSHILLMGKNVNFNSRTKMTLEPKVDFSELVLVPEPIILEPKLTILPSHILLLDIGISVMIFQDWLCKENKF